MNWKSTYTNFIKGNTAVGIDLTLLGDDKLMASLVVLKRKKNNLEIIRQCDDILSLEDLFAQISATNPILLSIDGKGIVHKSMKVGENESVDTIKLASQVFPNFSDKDFWVQKEIVDSQNIFISIARNELIQSIIGKFAARGLFIYSITVGHFAINFLSSLLLEYEYIECKSTKIGLSNGVISSLNFIEKDEVTTYLLGEERIDSRFFLAYANAFCFFVDKKTDCLQENEILKLQEDFFYKKGFTLLGYAALFLLFIGLLVNFIFFDHYNKKLAELSLNSTQSNDLVNQLNQLKKELKEKELFFTENKFLEMSKSSYFADRIAFLRPEGITLSQLNVFPIEKSIRNREEIKFKSNVILITGISTSVQDIDKWIKDLKKESWLKELSLVNLRQGETLNKTEFELELTIK